MPQRVRKMKWTRNGETGRYFKRICAKDKQKKQRNSRRAIEAMKTQKSIFVEGRQLFMRIKQN